MTNIIAFSVENFCISIKIDKYFFFSDCNNIELFTTILMASANTISLKIFQHFENNKKCKEGYWKTKHILNMENISLGKKNIYIYLR